MGQKLVTLSSAATTSGIAALDWRNNFATTASVTVNSTGATGGVVLQVADRDIMLNASSAVNWIGFSSAPIDVSTLSTTPIVYSFLSPFAGLRLSASTTISSGVVTLAIVQADH